jgi:DMSO/TMAO reductase YedYZ molybdopterin-dependent catalytic subunit
MPDEPIISPDTRRADRLPPGQTAGAGRPGQHAGPVSPFDPAAWDLTVFPVPLVDRVVRFTWAEFAALPRARVFADLHSARGWSRLDNLWEGVPTRELLRHVTPAPAARFVMVHAEYGYSANLPLDDFLAADSLFALAHDGRPLAPEAGHPVRLVVPRLFSWKSVKWVRGIEFMSDDRPGFHEAADNGGRPMRGDPWAGGDRPV